MREGSTEVCRLNIPNITITDFDIDSLGRMVYFCGKDWMLNTNVIGKFSMAIFCDQGINYIYKYPITLKNNTACLKKIDFYPSYTGKRLSLIANDDNTNAKYGVDGFALVFPPSYYVNFNIDSNTYR